MLAGVKIIKVLFASSEIYPLIKTGGLADVSQSLPRALKSFGHDIRLILPAYKGVKQQLKHKKTVAQITLQSHDVEIIKSRLPGTRLPIWLVDCPALFNREGGPYLMSKGTAWPDNAQRFALFSRVIAAIATDQIGLDWQPGILHCNDWQTGLAPALLYFEKSKPSIIFTIHNLAYQGLFPYSTYLDLKLPNELWSFESMEFFNLFSFIKGGIVYADQVNTVSPTYAKEIQTKEYGAGLEKLLEYHSKKLTGIVNGVNKDEWNPSKDEFIYTNFNIKSLNKKTNNKLKLQKELNLKVDIEIPLFVTVSRLAEQKGIDLILEIFPQLKYFDIQIVILGSGEEKLEKSLLKFAKNNSQQVYVKIGFDETLAHKMTAAGDFFIMPSRFEPCGLNQMYSQLYATIPIVRKTGGLADTVIDEPGDRNDMYRNTGIKFIEDNSDELLQAIIRGIEIYANKNAYKKMQLNAMRQDFSWKNSAAQYLDIYNNALTA